MNQLDDIINKFQTLLPVIRNWIDVPSVSIYSWTQRGHSHEQAFAGLRSR